MPSKFKTFLQHIAPQRLLTHFAGFMATCRAPWLKNYLINWFIHRYQVDIHEATLTSINDYPNFNSFFTRHLKPELRPIVTDPQKIACPADGFISQTGAINKNTLFQAKGFYYDLATLLGNDYSNVENFSDGNFATIYLSPRDYHRVHMPFSGKLRKTIYIPGKLFSVNRNTTLTVPNLFTRNERLAAIFDTEIGPMAVILIGAMLVGHIRTVWSANVVTTTLHTEDYSNQNITLARGTELGHFEMGSTVIVLFAKNKISWNEKLHEEMRVQMGEAIATLK